MIREYPSQSCVLRGRDTNPDFQGFTVHTQHVEKETKGLALSLGHGNTKMIGGLFYCGQF